MWAPSSPWRWARPQYGDGTTEHGAGIFGMGDLSSDGYNFYVALDWHHQDGILGANRNGAFTTTNWSSLPGGVNTQPGAIGASSLAYPDSVTGYLINPNTTSGTPYAFLPGCDQASQNADKCTFAFPGKIQSPTTQINLLSKFTKALADDWTVTVTGLGIRLVGAANRGHDVRSCLQQHGSGSRLHRQHHGFPRSAVLDRRVSHALAACDIAAQPVREHCPPPQSSLRIWSTASPTSAPIRSPWIRITYRLFGDMKGTVAGWDLHSSVGVMYASMTEKIFGSIYPGLAQDALNSGAYVPGVSTNGQSLFAPETSEHPSSTLGVASVSGIA